MCIAGPLGSLLINQFDCRTCLLVAGAMTLTGFTACFFTYDFFYLYPALILAGESRGNMKEIEHNDVKTE